MGNKFSFELNKLIKEDFIEMHSMIAAGGLFSCTEDLLNWILFHLSSDGFSPEKILDPDSLFEMHMPYIFPIIGACSSICLEDSQE